MVDQSLTPNHIILGADVVAEYFIKPLLIEKTAGPFLPHLVYEKEENALRVLDLRISQVANKLIFSRHLKPTNFVEEFDKFL